MSQMLWDTMLVLWGSQDSLSYRKAQSSGGNINIGRYVIHGIILRRLFSSVPKCKFLLYEKILTGSGILWGSNHAHKGEIWGLTMCFTLINELRQCCVLLMYPGDLDRSLLLLLLFYSPAMSLQHLLFSGFCPWEQNKLNIFFLQPLMNINIVFIYCLAKYDKNKNALQRKRTCIHQKYLATVRILVPSSLSIDARLTSMLYTLHRPTIPSNHWLFLKGVADCLAATCRTPTTFKAVQFCHA